MLRVLKMLIMHGVPIRLIVVLLSVMAPKDYLRYKKAKITSSTLFVFLDCFVTIMLEAKIN